MIKLWTSWLLFVIIQPGVIFARECTFTIEPANEGKYSSYDLYMVFNNENKFGEDRSAYIKQLKGPQNCPSLYCTLRSDWSAPCGVA